ncbi:MAG: alcohol dehydrogenase catalytic domain-containing protein [Gemmatimonadota bacterium]
MRALVKAGPTEGFELRDVPVPTIREDEVLIRVRAAGVCGTDVHIHDWDAWAQGRCRPPFTVGHEFSGVVERVGGLVTSVQVGDRVTAEGHIVCGRCHLCRTGNAHVCPATKIIGVDRDGAFADYIAMPASNVWHLDPAVSFAIGGIHDPMGNAFHTALHGTQLPGARRLVSGCVRVCSFAGGFARAAGE